MKLIARNDGPNYNGVIGSGALTTGKEYESIQIAYQVNGNARKARAKAKVARRKADRRKNKQILDEIR
jgi:hypothetical protein